MDSHQYTNVLVTLPSGNRAVYEVLPRFVPDPAVPESADYPQQYGRQVAHEQGGVWFYPRGWVPVSDAPTLALVMKLTQPNVLPSTGTTRQS